MIKLRRKEKLILDDMNVGYGKHIQDEEKSGDVKPWNKVTF